MAQVASIKLSPEMKVRLAALAEATKRTQHSIMVEAVESYVERQEQREKFRLEGIRAYNDFVETGLHLTGAEIDAWIDGVLAKTQNPEELPKCHV